MRVRIIYTLTKTLQSDGTYKVAVQVDASEGITPKIFVFQSGEFITTARPPNIELYPEDNPAQEGGFYRLDSAEVEVDNVEGAEAEARGIEYRIDYLAREYQEQAGNFDATEQVEVEYGN